jgi:chromosome segregation protein
VFLRSITIRGFKSFADKTTLEFTPGVSVIVGPNGSGKSNIADAIAWVLGEQGPRALRGAQMADVIFAGSPSRAALGMAEVSLVIDNEAGLVPVPASEIEISRAIYRSGESEYRLGGRPCRLLDIQELLSDTGVGRALHTVIGQGHLEDVLSASPEARRQLVEEAAGIGKHRRRRERAERRLGGLEQDLLRLQDVVGELRRQLKPLRQQAELARRHEELTSEAADLARNLAAVRLRALREDRDRRRPSWEEAEAIQRAARLRLEELGQDIDRLERERAEAQALAAQAEERQAEAVRGRSEAESRLRTSMRREAEARERLSVAANRSARLFALEEELERTDRALADVRRSLDSKEAELSEAEAAFVRLQAARRDVEEERRRADSHATASRIEAESLMRAVSAHEAERERLREMLGDLHREIDAESSRGEALEREVERLDALETPLAAEQSRLDRERTETARALADLEALEKGLLARQEVVDARQIELSESPGVRFARRRGDRPVGVLRDLIAAPPHLRAPVRAALGPFADAVVYRSHAEALEEAAVEPGSGVTLLPADAGPDDAAASAPPATAGAVPLLDLVRPDPRVARLARRLLGRVRLVGTLAEATARHRLHPGGLFVTSDGILVGPTFVRTAPGVEGRIISLRRDSAALERELSAVRRDARERRRSLETLEERARIVQAELKSADGLITSAAEEMAGVRTHLGSLEREAAMVTQRLATVEASVAEATARLVRMPAPAAEPPALPPVPEPPIQLRVEVEALRRERTRLEAGVTRARKDIAALAAEDPIALRADLVEAEAARSEAEEDLRAAEVAVKECLGAYRTAAQSAERVQAAAASANRTWREQAAVVESLREEHEAEDRARSDLERRIEEAERVLRAGHGIEPSSAVAELGEDETVESLQRRSDLVARRMGLLGRVNLLAAGELESVQERHDFLVRELEDVRAARRDLLEVIEEVDRQMAEMFGSAFRDIAREFADLFAALFPGGEGRLSLTAPDLPLASGVEVEARPGGKRVRRLSLLSGGERSLAALALLFAVFRARPSPFYLMDEVEAALDDVNLSRFLDVVRGFAERSQIIIVTHQKRTMETADVLYGVSMAGAGVSTVISQPLAEVRAG